MQISNTKTKQKDLKVSNNYKQQTQNGCEFSQKTTKSLQLKKEQLTQNVNQAPLDSEQNNSKTIKNQPKEEQNDYQCDFKLIVKEKFKQKLKHEESNDFFMVVVNQIIEQRAKRTFKAQQDGNVFQAPGPTQLIQTTDTKDDNEKKGPTFYGKLRAQDQQIKRKIKQLRRKKPSKKKHYEFDPNRDKGFILAKKMNQIKQERQRKFLENKKQYEQMVKLQSQLDSTEDPSQLKNISTVLQPRIKTSRFRYLTKQPTNLPRITQNNTFFTQSLRSSKQDFYQIATSRCIISQQKYNQRKSRLNSLSLSNKYQNSQKKRDLQREIQILRKSQIITQKYYMKKFMKQLLQNIISQAVRIVENKKQFFLKSPPKPVHEMLANYKDKNGKGVWLPGSKQQKFRINIHLPGKGSQKCKQIKCQSNEDKEEECEQKQVKKWGNRENLKQIKKSFNNSLKDGKQIQKSTGQKIENQEESDQFQNNEHQKVRQKQLMNHYLNQQNNENHNNSENSSIEKQDHQQIDKNESQLNSIEDQQKCQKKQGSDQQQEEQSSLILTALQPVQIQTELK